MTVTDTSASSADSEISAAEVAANLGENTVDTPATNGETAPNLLDHVKSVLQPKDEEQEAPPAGAQTEEQGAEKADATAETEPDDSKLPFHTHPRWKEVIEQKNAFKKEAEETKRQLQELEPAKADAQNYQAIVGYMRETGLSSQEVNTGFEIMSAIKNDPQRALELLQPYLTDLRAFTGEILPPDLAAKVESGDVEEATARELARTRNAAEYERQRREGVESKHREVQQRQSQQAISDRMTTALLGWETQVKSSDPDWAKKEDMVLAYLRSENLARPPRSEADAVANAKAAYEKVNQAVSRILPQRQPTPRTVPSNESINGHRPEPKTALDAAKLALERGR